MIPVRSDNTDIWNSIKDNILTSCILDYNPLELDILFDQNTPYKYLLRAENTFYNMRYDFLKGHITNRSKIIDVGDVNGFFISKFGTSESLSINIKKLDDRINNRFQRMDITNGINSIPESFDYGIIFETLEHLDNPILVLSQLMEHCDIGVFISIPNVKKTKTKLDINSGHVFEFSPKDFKKILDHYRFCIADYKECIIINRSLMCNILNLYGKLRYHNDDTLCGVFKSFQLYYLVKETVILESLSLNRNRGIYSYYKK